ERAVGALELDRLGGLLRRMPWTGGAFLLGAMAIAGLPPLNGFASEWLTLQALLHVPASGRIGDGLAGALALAALAATAALAVLCFVKVVGLVLLGPPRRAAASTAVEPPLAMRAAAPAPPWACGQLVEPQLYWTSAGFTKPLRLVLEAILRPQREIEVRVAGGLVQEVSYSGRVPQLLDERLYRPAVEAALAA